ncbi:MAG: FtsQ-type POTRA domain-containing protein [Tissierellia bacterium]|nr:FtsQ-type POTRA domain-containing protein [Tissierellia bacterium]
MKKKKARTRRIKQRKRRKIIRIISRFIIFFAILLLLISGIKKIGFFTIKDVTVAGNEKIKDKTVIEKTHLIKGSNYYEFSKKKRLQELQDIPYIKNGKIKYHLGGKVHVDIVERRPLFQVFGNAYYLVDREFRILEEQKEKTENILNVLGLDLENKKPGQYILDEEDLSKRKLMEKILATDYQLAENLRSIELADAVANFVTMEGIIVEFGSYNNIDYKLKMLGLILEDIKETDRKASLIQLEKGPNPILVEERDTKDKKGKEEKDPSDSIDDQKSKNSVVDKNIKDEAQDEVKGTVNSE